MRKTLVALALVAASVSAMAQTSLQIHGVSFHTHKGNWNEVNQGLGIRHQVDENIAVQAGFYKNSEFRHTNYALMEVMPFDTKIGAFVGLATGYKTNPQGVVMGGLAARIDTTWGNVSFKFIPKVKATASGVLAVDVGVNF